MSYEQVYQPSALFISQADYIKADWDIMKMINNQLQAQLVPVIKSSATYDSTATKLDIDLQ